MGARAGNIQASFPRGDTTTRTGTSTDTRTCSTPRSGAGASTWPMVIFSKIKLGVTPDINALATLIIGTVSIGIIIASWIMFRQNKRNEAG